VDLIQDKVRKEDHSKLPVAPAISDDPFADEMLGTRRKLFFAVILFLIIAGVFAFFFIFQSGF
jgi:hypothetical protein